MASIVSPFLGEEETEDGNRVLGVGAYRFNRILWPLLRVFVLAGDLQGFRERAATLRKLAARPFFSVREEIEELEDVWQRQPGLLVDASWLVGAVDLLRRLAAVDARRRLSRGER